jgi:hypothetical protein
MDDINWATVGTWVQAIGGLGALFFLIKTFKEQRKVTEYQYKLTELELIRFKDSNKPFINLVAFSSGLLTKESVFFLNIHLMVQDNFLTNLEYKSWLPDFYKFDINLKQSESIIFIGSSINLEMWVSRVEHSEFSIDYSKSYKDGLDVVYKEALGEIIFAFKDKNNNSYEQKLVIDSHFQCYLKPMQEMKSV